MGAIPPGCPSRSRRGTQAVGTRRSRPVLQARLPTGPSSSSIIADLAITLY
jgi:hypothetical protein